MKTHLILNKKTYLQLVLIVPTIALMGLTNSAIAGGRVKHNHATGYPQIRPSVYNSEEHSFDRPWPFGPESTQQ
jgi:hypothetical protein